MARSPDRRPRSLIGLLYDELGSHSRAAFLAAFAERTGAASVHILDHDYDTGDGAVVDAVGWEASYHKGYCDYYSTKDPWMAARERLTPELVTTGNMLIQDQQFRRSEFYNDFLRPQDRCYVIGCVLGVWDSKVRVLAALRHDGEPAWERRWLHLLRKLVPELTRAEELRAQWAQLDQRATIGREALDWVGAAVIILDKHGEPVLTNGYAGRLLHEATALHVSGNRLSARNSAEGRALGRLVRTSQESVTPQAAGYMSITRQGAPPLQVVVRRLRAQSSLTAVLVTDPGVRTSTPVEALRSLYGLTYAEARLTRALVDGSTLAEAAARFGIRVATARSQLKMVFAKTGTRRQAELSQLVERVIRPLTRR